MLYCNLWWNYNAWRKLHFNHITLNFSWTSYPDCEVFSILKGRFLSQHFTPCLRVKKNIHSMIFRYIFVTLQYCLDSRSRCCTTSLLISITYVAQNFFSLDQVMIRQIMAQDSCVSFVNPYWRLLILPWMISESQHSFNITWTRLHDYNLSILEQANLGSLLGIFL